MPAHAISLDPAGEKLAAAVMVEIIAAFAIFLELHHITPSIRKYCREFLSGGIPGSHDRIPQAVPLGAVNTTSEFHALSHKILPEAQGIIRSSSLAKTYCSVFIVSSLAYQWLRDSARVISPPESENTAVITSHRNGRSSMIFILLACETADIKLLSIEAGSYHVHVIVSSKQSVSPAEGAMIRRRRTRNILIAAPNE